MKYPKTLVNAKGKEVPMENVRPEHYKKHLMVEKIFEEAAKLQKQMIRAKAKFYKKITEYENWLAKVNGLDDAEFEDLTLSNYSQDKRVMIKNGSTIEFDETLQLAKVRIDNCLSRWGENADTNLKTIVDSYFKVGKKGFINKNAILGLFQFEIKDPEWAEAMELIKKSIVETEKKQYTMLQVRDGNKTGWEPFNLNFSSLPKE